MEILLTKIFGVSSWVITPKTISIISEIAERAINPSIRTSDSEALTVSNQYELCDFRDGTIPAEWTLFSCEPPRTARYVSFHVHKPGGVNLNFQEIEVHGFCTDLLLIRGAE